MNTTGRLPPPGHAQFYLLCDHTQHFKFDSVELVEAGPGSGRRQAFEKLAHGKVVQAVRTVEHNALKREKQVSEQLLDQKRLWNMLKPCQATVRCFSRYAGNAVVYWVIVVANTEFYNLVHVYTINSYYDDL